MDIKLIIGFVASAIAGALLLVWVLVQVYSRVDNPAVKNPLHSLLKLIDTCADNMEIAQKRSMVIIAFQQALVWKRIVLPSFIIGIFIDGCVWLVRKVGVPDLHKAGEEEKQP